MSDLTDYDELITRLRELAERIDQVDQTYSTDAVACEKAADALEAAQAELRLVQLQQDIKAYDAITELEAERDAAQAERDAEAALAETAMRGIDLFMSDAPDSDVAAAFALAQEMRDDLAAHRERRTTPTKDGRQ